VCDCTNFREYEAPCSHVIIVCKYDQKDPFDYFSDFYTTKAFTYGYRRPLPPVSINNLPLDPTIQPPILVKQRGRPKTKRIRNGALRRTARDCGNCGEKGHNRQSCRGQPSSSGRGGRARDWIESDKESIGKEDNGIALEDQLSADLIEYDLQIARARAIVARLEKDQSRGQESDSDLLLVASSQFEGMEL